MNFQTGLENFQSAGLNLFLSTKVSDLPEDIQQFFTTEQKEKTLCLLGNGGPSMWKHIDLSIPNPVDQFSVTEMKKFGSDVLEGDIEILFPADFKTLPLQKISRALGLSTQSALGIDISEDYGLWFAFRGVFLTSQSIPLIKKNKAPNPCERCHRPCLSEPHFMQARLKCPVQTHQQYSENQRDYHQSVIEKLKKFF